MPDKRPRPTGIVSLITVVLILPILTSTTDHIRIRLGMTKSISIGASSAAMI